MPDDLFLRAPKAGQAEHRIQHGKRVGGVVSTFEDCGNGGNWHWSGSSDEALAGPARRYSGLKLSRQATAIRLGMIAHGRTSLRFPCRLQRLRRSPHSREIAPN
jgi:hypothetical protein